MRDRDFRNDSNGTWMAWMLISVFCLVAGIGAGLVMAGVLR